MGSSNIYIFLVMLRIMGIRSGDISMEHLSDGLPAAAESRPAPAHRYHPIYEPYEERDYKFGYEIKDDYTYNQHSREEHKHGKTVTGRYTILEPNGYLRIVNYVADDYGFRADVENQPTHNLEYNHKPKQKAPVYLKPPPHHPVHPSPPIYDRSHQMPSSRAQTYVPQLSKPLPPILPSMPPPPPAAAYEQATELRSVGRLKYRRPEVKLHKLRMQISPSPRPSPPIKLIRRRPLKKNKQIHSVPNHLKMHRPNPHPMPYGYISMRPISGPEFQQRDPPSRPYVPAL